MGTDTRPTVADECICLGYPHQPTCPMWAVDFINDEPFPPDYEPFDD